MCALGTGRAAVFSRYHFMLVQILRSMRPPSSPKSGPSIRIQPFGRTCQFQLITVPSPSAAKVSTPEVCIIELVVRETSRCGRSNSLNSTPPSIPGRLLEPCARTTRTRGP